MSSIRLLEGVRTFICLVGGVPSSVLSAKFNKVEFSLNFVTHLGVIFCSMFYLSCFGVICVHYFLPSFTSFLSCFF